MTLGADPDKFRHKRNLKRRANRQERDTAKEYRGSRQPGSGSGWLRKNDVRSEHLLIECKFTTNTKSYSVKDVELRELCMRAVLEDRIPVLKFELAGNSYVILTNDDFLGMIDD